MTSSSAGRITTCPPRRRVPTGTALEGVFTRTDYRFTRGVEARDGALRWDGLQGAQCLEVAWYHHNLATPLRPAGADYKLPVRMLSAFLADPVARGLTKTTPPYRNIDQPDTPSHCRLGDQSICSRTMEVRRIYLK